MSSRSLRSRVVRMAAATMVPVLLASCSSDGDPAVGPTTPPATVGGGADDGDVVAVAEADPTRFQDVWVYERIATVDPAGEVVDLTTAVVATANDLGESTAIVDDVEFREWPALAPRLVDGDGTVRDDVDVVAGLVGDGDAARVVVIGTPDGDETPPIDDDDRVQLDLTAIEDRLAPGDPLIVDHAMASTHGPDEADAPEGGVELLAHRVATGRARFASDPVSGRPAVVTDLGQARAGSVIGEVPAKAQPMVDGFTEGVKECEGSFGIECVSDFLEKFGEGAAASHQDVIGQQLCVDCNGGDDPGDRGPDPDAVGPDDPADDPDPPPARPRDEPEPEEPEEPDPGQPDPTPSDRAPDRGFKTSDKVGRAKCVANCPGEKPPCWVFCDTPWKPGRANAEPHVQTFDGTRYDLQSVGEFVLADTEGWMTQARFVPYPSGRRLSIVGAVATRFGDDVVVIEAREASAARVTVNGEVVELVDNGPEVTRGDLLLRSHRDTVQVGVPGVGMVGARQVLGRLDVDVLPDADREFRGVLGDGDGDPTNDLRIASTGELLDAEDPEFGRLHGEYADSWRVTDETSLFSYDDGESTATFTDLEYPVESIADVVARSPLRARAETLCRIVGLEAGDGLEECITDYAVTGEASWVSDAVRSARLRTVQESEPVYAAAAGELVWVGVVDGIRSPQPLQHAGDTIVLQGRGADGDVLVGLDAGSGQERWRLAGIATDCPATVVGERVLAITTDNGPAAGPDGASMVAIDARTGRVLDEPRFGGREGERIQRCTALTNVGDVVVHTAGGRLRAFTGGDLTPLWERRLSGVAGPAPIAASDDAFWVASRGADATVIELVTARDGVTTASVEEVGSVPTARSAAVAPSGELIVAFRDGSSARLVEVSGGPDGPLALRELVGAEELGPVELLGADATNLYVYTADAEITAFAREDGRPSWRSKTTEFQNNGGLVVPLGDGTVLAASFGGAHLEAHGPDGLQWSLDPDDVFEGDVDPGPTSQIGPMRDGVVHAASSVGAITVVVAVVT